MKSMTGFGRSLTVSRKAAASEAAPAEPRASEFQLDISIKSVNGRYLDLRFHLPREYASFEGELKSLLTPIFTRGTVDIYINRLRSAETPTINVNLDLAEAWVQSYRLLAQNLHLNSEPTLEMISRVPEIFRVETESEVSDAEKSAVKVQLLEAALGCDRERTREGAALQKELGVLCTKLQALAEQAEELKAEAGQELDRKLRERLEDQLKKRGFEGKIDDQRLAQEIVMMLDKADIAEEIQRLREHISAYAKLLMSTESQGKKLDFYAQELLREVNTIGSKSHLTKLTHIVVEAKTIVERIREQVQNIE